MSGSYERMNYITSFGFSLRWRRQFIEALPASDENIKVIDLMSGMGETWHQIRRHYPKAELSALDFCEGMLKPSRHKNEQEFGNSVRILQQDLLKNELASDQYDVVLSAFGMKTFNAEQLKILAAEIKRILKPGGRFSMIEVSAPDGWFLHALYKLHLKYVVPFCGWIFLGNPSEYKMLWKYTEMYRNSKAAVTIFREAGLEVKPMSYFFGCASGVVGLKK